MERRRTWDVLLVGGASGVGKTSVGYRLARHFEAGLVEIDDIKGVLERMTTPEQYPALHYFRVHAAEEPHMDDERIVAGLLGMGEVLSVALEVVIRNHLASRTPLVLEGDYLLPSLALRPTFGGVPAGGRVRAIFLVEDDERQFRRNFHEREGDEQPRRARVSRHHSEWLRREAERVGLPAVPARPRHTVLERVIAALDPA
jgi:2-phosphoglycerate kinase